MESGGGGAFVAGGAGGGGGGRTPTWRERENNKRRERRRRAVAAKIFAGLRAHGGYRLPKHCDNNEVLKALCDEAGWVVQPDGTTYRKGTKPPPERTDGMGRSVSPSPCSSYQPSPGASYNASPTSSSFPSGASSPFLPPTDVANGIDDSPILPWLKTFSYGTASRKHPLVPPLSLIHGGSISAPVTPLSSPTARMRTGWDESSAVQPPWHGTNSPSIANSTPPIPGRATGPDPAGLAAGIQIVSTSPSSPTFSLVSANPFGVFKDAVPVRNSSRMMCTPPGRSGTCSPAVPGMPAGHPNVHMVDAVSDEFAFGSSADGAQQAAGLVRAWEGERIHEDSGSDDLDVTLKL